MKTHLMGTLRILPSSMWTFVSTICKQASKDAKITVIQGNHIKWRIGKPICIAKDGTFVTTLSER